MNSVNDRPIPSGLTSRICPLISLQIPSTLSLSITFVELSVKPVYPTVLGAFTNMRCSDYWKMYLKVNELKVDIYSCPLGKTFSPVFVITPSGKGKIIKKSENLFSSEEERGEKGGFARSTIGSINPSLRSSQIIS